MTEILEDLQRALDQVPKKEYRAEAEPLADKLQRERRRAKGPQPLAEALAIVLARLGVAKVQSAESGAKDLT
jgi:hypothetical protein